MLLIPLAVTSTQGMIRRLGGKRWARLHRLIYLVAAVGVFHFLWLVKRDVTTPDYFGGALILLLATRLIPARRHRQSPPDRRAEIAPAPARA